MAKIIVLSGGNSNEREVSLRSGKAVAAALAAAGHEVVSLDVSCADHELSNCDAVFPVLHGAGGEDGQIQARLESLGVLYVGSDVDASRLCMDKNAYRAALSAAGFLMPEGCVVSWDDYVQSTLSTKPHVLKPVAGGSSIDTFIIRDIAARNQTAIQEAFDRHKTMLLEELIVGTEATVGVLGQEVLPVIEIIPPAEGEFDYENKYNGATQELIPPLHISEGNQARVREIALRAHIEAGCRDLSRSDFIITAEGQCYLLETNTIPGLTDQSLYPKMAAAAGLDMPALCDRLVQFALDRHA